MDTALTELRRKGYQARQSSQSGEIWLQCPFCVLRGKTPDREYKLGLNIRKNVGHCFRCGYKSRHVLQDLKIAVFEAGEEESKEITVPKLPEDFELIDTTGSDYWMKKALRYLLERGMSKDQIRYYRVGLSLVGRFRSRVVFPIYKEKKLVGYTGRTITSDGQPKWLHSANLKAVFPAAFGRFEHTVISEGVFDSLAVTRAVGTMTDSQAILGTHLSDDKMKLLDNYREFTVWFDPDIAGGQGAVEVAERLVESGKRVYVVASRKEPADLSQEEIIQAYQSRVLWSFGEGMNLLANFVS